MIYMGLFGGGRGPKNRPKLGGAGKPPEKKATPPGGGRAGAAERGEIAKRLKNVEDYLRMFRGGNLPSAVLALGELSEIKKINKPVAVTRLPAIIKDLVAVRDALQCRGNMSEMLKADEILIDACRLAESNDPLRNLVNDYGGRANTAMDAKAQKLWETASKDVFRMMDLLGQHTMQLMRRFPSPAQEAEQRAVKSKLIADQFELIKQDFIALAQYSPASRRT